MHDSAARGVTLFGVGKRQQCVPHLRQQRAGASDARQRDGQDQQQRNRIAPKETRAGQPGRGQRAQRFGRDPRARLQALDGPQVQAAELGQLLLRPLAGGAELAEAGAVDVHGDSLDRCGGPGHPRAVAPCPVTTRTRHEPDTPAANPGKSGAGFIFIVAETGRNQ